MDEDWLAIYDFSGTFVSNIQTEATRFDWLPE